MKKIQAPAYSIVDVRVRDEARFQQYVDGHMATLTPYGGRFLVAGGRFDVVEGDWTPHLLVVHRWPSRAAFYDWYGSEAYRPWKRLRRASSTANVVLVEGLPEDPEAGGGDA